MYQNGIEKNGQLRCQAPYPLGHVIMSIKVIRPQFCVISTYVLMKIKFYDSRFGWIHDLKAGSLFHNLNLIQKLCW